MIPTPAEPSTAGHEHGEKKIPMFADSPFGFFHYIVTVVTFLACWGYAIALWGWFVGIGLGWIPALVFAAIVWALLPLAAFLTCIVIVIGIVVFFVLILCLGSTGSSQPKVRSTITH